MNSSYVVFFYLLALPWEKAYFFAASYRLRWFFMWKKYSWAWRVKEYTNKQTYVKCSPYHQALCEIVKHSDENRNYFFPDCWIRKCERQKEWLEGRYSGNGRYAQARETIQTDGVSLPFCNSVGDFTNQGTLSWCSKNSIKIKWGDLWIILIFLLL